MAQQTTDLIRDMIVINYQPVFGPTTCFLVLVATNQASTGLLVEELCELLEVDPVIVGKCDVARIGGSTEIDAGRTGFGVGPTYCFLDLTAKLTLGLPDSADKTLLRPDLRNGQLISLLSPLRLLCPSTKVYHISYCNVNLNC